MLSDASFACVAHPKWGFPDIPRDGPRKRSIHSDVQLSEALMSTLGGVFDTTGVAQQDLVSESITQTHEDLLEDIDAWMNSHSCLDNGMASSEGAVGAMDSSADVNELNALDWKTLMMLTCSAPESPVGSTELSTPGPEDIQPETPSSLSSDASSPPLPELDSQTFSSAAETTPMCTQQEYAAACGAAYGGFGGPMEWPSMMMPMQAQNGMTTYVPYMMNDMGGWVGLQPHLARVSTGLPSSLLQQAHLQAMHAQQRALFFSHPQLSDGGAMECQSQQLSLMQMAAMNGSFQGVGSGMLQRSVSAPAATFPRASQQSNVLSQLGLQTTASQAPAEAGGGSLAKKRHGITKTLTLEILAKHFTQPIQTAATKLGVSARTLKKVCRQFGIDRWPYRKLQMLDRNIQRLQQTALDLPSSEKVRVTGEVTRVGNTLQQHTNPEAAQLRTVASKTGPQKTIIKTNSFNSIVHALKMVHSSSSAASSPRSNSDEAPTSPLCPNLSN